MAEIVAVEELQKVAVTWPERARELQILDAATYEVAAQHLIGIKGLRRQIDETFDPIIKRAHEAHKQAVASKKAVEAPLAEAETIIKRAMAAYQEEQERRRREEEARLAAEARRQEEERLLQEALLAEADGDYELAEEIIAAPVTAPTIHMPRATPKVAGISYRETWGARVVNMAALIRFVAANPSFINLLSPNMPALNALARAQRQALNIPGVQAFAERVVAAGS